MYQIPNVIHNPVVGLGDTEGHSTFLEGKVIFFPYIIRDPENPFLIITYFRQKNMNNNNYNNNRDVAHGEKL